MTFPSLDKLPATYAQAPVIVREEQFRAMARAIRPIELDAKAESPWDTGMLRRSITSRIESAVGSVTGIAGTNVPYARVVEDGRTAGAAMPPSGVLLQWMRRHGIDAEQEYLIRRAIGRKGTKPQPYLRPAFRKNLDNAYQELGPKCAARILARLKAAP